MVVVAAPSLHGVDLVVELILVAVVKLIWIAAVRLQFGGLRDDARFNNVGVERDME